MKKRVKTAYSIKQRIWVTSLKVGVVMAVVKDVVVVDAAVVEAGVEVAVSAADSVVWVVASLVLVQPVGQCGAVPWRSKVR
ncbi:hypothetical protein D3C71_1675750 [compost metagenome]